MNYNKNITENSVPAKNQVHENFKAKISINDKIRILFLGNSITLHEKAPKIGWNNDWGMAASALEKDYVHLVLDYFQNKFGQVGFAICNVSNWERNFIDEKVLEQFSNAKKFYPDIIISRLGENVDVKLLDGDNFYLCYKKFLEYFKTSNSKVIVTDLFWEYKELDNAIYKLCDTEKYSLVKLGDLGYEDCFKAIGQFAHKGVSLHPNDKGMKAIADRIIEKLKKY